MAASPAPEFNIYVRGANEERVKVRRRPSADEQAAPLAIALRWRPLSVGAVQRQTAVVLARGQGWLCGEGGCGWCRRRLRRGRRDLD